MPDLQEITSTSQDFLEIFDITRNATILKDGTVSVILAISAMNFGLLAEAEQDAIIYAYAALLNSLNFPIQIVIRSKTKDATTYLGLLDAQARKSSSEKKKNQIKRYQDFVSQLIKERNVLDKKFYVIIPALPAEVGMITVESVLPGKTTPQLTRDQKSAVLEKALGILEPRRDHMIAQFNRIGLYARQLETQEIIEIFYSSYNPNASEGQQITSSKNYTTMMVNASTTLPTPPPEEININPTPTKEEKLVVPETVSQPMTPVVKPIEESLIPSENLIEPKPELTAQPIAEQVAIDNTLVSRVASEPKKEEVQTLAPELNTTPIIEKPTPKQPVSPSPLPPVAEL